MPTETPLGLHSVEGVLVFYLVCDWERWRIYPKHQRSKE